MMKAIRGRFIPVKKERERFAVDNSIQLSDELLSSLIDEAKYDEVGLWMVIATVRRELNISDPASLRAATFDVVRRLLGSGDVAAYFYGSGPTDRYEPLRNDMPNCVAEIERKWDELGREPNIGEIVIFVEKD